MKSYKIYLTINEYKHNSSPKEEIPVKQFTLDNHIASAVEINFNEDGTISEIMIDDHEENILIIDDYNTKSKILIKYVHDAKGNLINEIEVDENDVVLSETNYGYDDNNRMIHQEIKTDNELWSINFHLDKDGHQKLIEHFTNGKLTMSEQIENFQNKHITYNIDENGKQRQKWLRLFDGNGNLSSVSEYDDHNILVKIVSNYYDNDVCCC